MKFTRILQRALVWIPASAAICLSQDTSNGYLSSVALFNRCYAHLTRNRIPTNDPRLQQVASGALSPIDACMQVLNSANLISSGTYEGYLPGGGNASGEATSVIRTFNDFHRSWFPSDTFTISVPDSEALPCSQYVYDTSEPALHLTRALLQSDVEYADIVTSDPVLESLRTSGLSGVNPPAQFYNPNNDPGLASLCNINQLNGSFQPGQVSVSGLSPGQLPAAQNGTLFGVRPVTLNAMKQNAVVNGYTTPMNGSNQAVGTVAPGAINQTFGGGVLGSPSFLMLNMGRPDLGSTDGGIKVSRRWAKAVLNNLLCRDVPALRSSDGALYVESKPTATTPPFRQAATCMQCHGSMDPMAYTVRNLSFAASSAYSATNWGIAMVVKVGQENSASETGLVDSDPLFYTRPTNGRLTYRSYDGTLINIPVHGLDELGEAISKTNDLYVCAASRYFEYFTGITVNLQDIGDPSLPPISEEDLQYRNQVIQMGLELKKSQSLQSLIQSILNSDVYKTTASRDVAGTSN